MTGRQLKALVGLIPDDAVVLVSGPDDQGYEYTYNEKAVLYEQVAYKNMTGRFLLKGVVSVDLPEVDWLVRVASTNS